MDHYKQVPKTFWERLIVDMLEEFDQIMKDRKSMFDV